MIDPISAFLGVFGAVGSGIIFGLKRRSDRRLGVTVAWRQRAEDCGLTDIQTGSRFLFRGFLTGRRGRHAVRVERFKRGKSREGTRVIVGGLTEGLSLKREGLGATIEKAMGSREVDCGDEAFDAEVFVQGPASLVRALLDAETRQLVRALFGGHVSTKLSAPRTVEASISVAYGELHAEFPDRFMGSWDEPHTDTLQSLLALAERLAPLGTLEQRLGAIAKEDPHPRVRGQALATLEREYPSAAATREAMAHAADDADPEVRLQSGLWLGAGGQAVLEELAASDAAPDSCSARALAGLGARLDQARAASLLDSAVRSGRLATAEAALAALAGGGASSVDAIARCLDDPRDRVVVAAAHALGGTASALAEEPLLRALERGPDPVLPAVAHALGQVGTARAVLPLKELQDRTRGETHKTAREAVVRIQSRLTGATPGQLAMADEASGHVSLSDDPGGRVTLPES